MKMRIDDVHGNLCREADNETILEIGRTMVNGTAANAYSAWVFKRPGTGGNASLHVAGAP
jgi:hypothetical protein